MHKLEVIVMSAEEARIAEAGGADRLELVRALDTGGLTPDHSILEAVLTAVKIPVRTMLRENATMQVADAAESATLAAKAEAIQKLPVDGIVLGWITPDGRTDEGTLKTVLQAAGRAKITFHRAFEHMADPLAELQRLKKYPQIDRILTSGGTGTWDERKVKLRRWSEAAAPEIGILVGGGLTSASVLELMADAQFPEIHVGRAVRTPERNSGAIDPAKIRQLKRAAP